MHLRLGGTSPRRRFTLPAVEGTPLTDEEYRRAVRNTKILVIIFLAAVVIVAYLFGRLPVYFLKRFLGG